ncbi:MAG: EAL domain-containing protein [Gammaproteobacteria bacterium]|nr:EAL domain-containing protein [Gammaproteobacteria bacterium]
MKVAVNVSAQQFKNRDFSHLIADKLTNFKLPAEQIELEITESALIDNFDNAKLTINKLKDIGVSIALDDFGTGYSSLSYLKNFNLDTLKVDKSCINNINTDVKSMNILNAIVTLAQSLRLKIVCEGIETEEQLSLLAELQCEDGQGYLYCKPKNLNDIRKFLEMKY